MGECITVVRLPWPRRPRLAPTTIVISAVARVNMVLADELHAPSSTDQPVVRPYAVDLRAETLDIHCFRDDVAQALLAAEGARIVSRVPVEQLRAGPVQAKLALTFRTPTIWRVQGFDHFLPDSVSVFDTLRERWDALGWPPLLDDPALRVLPMRRLPTEYAALRTETLPSEGGRPQAGIVGTVVYETRGLQPVTRAALWTLARFATYRGVGRLTSYGFGRVTLEGRAAASRDTAAPRVPSSQARSNSA